MYPGTTHHQALLEHLVNYYKDDDRILAVCLFGSLARGNWDERSDLDLDVVIKDGVQIAVLNQLRELCTAFQPLGETALIIVPNGSDSGDVVLSSLTEFSIRYHTLTTTSPNIVDSLRLLVGKIDIEAIKVAGFANQTARPPISNNDVDRVLRWALELDICLHRQKFWQGVQLLQLMREKLIEIFAFSRGYPRAYPAFEAHASDALKGHITQTLPRDDLKSLQEASLVMLDILENDLSELSNGQLELTATQSELIAVIRAKSIQS